MNYGPLLFLAAFFALATSWFGLVLTPQVQLGRLQPTNAVPAGSAYPVNRPGLARQGMEVYRANGCATCHSQQLSQNTTVFEVLLTDPGTNHAVLLSALLKVDPSLSGTNAQSVLNNLPRVVFRSPEKEPADAALRTLNVGGDKVALAIVPGGPDMAAGWGARRSVAEDFLYDYPVMPGSQRVGPDLANVAARLPDANWHLLHLYAPRVKVADSVMPPYRFLFEKRRIEHGASPDALSLPAELSPGLGYEIVPRPEAKALVAYLLSLRADAPLFDAPLSPALSPASSSAANAPAK